MQRTENNSLTSAVIYMKSGKRKYGLLLESCEQQEYRFVSNTDMHSYAATNDRSLVELLPESLIEAIETFLK